MRLTIDQHLRREGARDIVARHARSVCTAIVKNHEVPDTCTRKPAGLHEPAFLLGEDVTGLAQRSGHQRLALGPEGTIMDPNAMTIWVPNITAFLFGSYYW